VKSGHDFLQARVVADDLGRAAPRSQLLLQQDVLRDDPAPCESTLYQQQEVVGIDRLGKEVEGALLHGRHGVLDASVGRHDHDREFRVELSGGVQHAQAVAHG